MICTHALILKGLKPRPCGSGGEEVAFSRPPVCVKAGLTQDVLTFISDTCLSTVRFSPGQKNMVCLREMQYCAQISPKESSLRGGWLCFQAGGYVLYVQAGGYVLYRSGSGPSSATTWCVTPRAGQAGQPHSLCFCLLPVTGDKTLAKQQAGPQEEGTLWCHPLSVL